MTTANPETTFTFADDVGGKYVTKYERNARGLHVWTAERHDGASGGYTDFANRERDLSAEEIEARAKGATSLLVFHVAEDERSKGTAESEIPTGKVYRTRTA